MKIHEIKIENIASLRGKHHINFDQLSDQGPLFAITGKTGAGKSTILNCISLALYNKVYKKDSTSNDFVSLGEAQGNIELIFSANGKKYKANWAMRTRKKNGELLKKPDFTRTLSQFNGLKYTAIDDETSDILNLNFDQFCKTCILNQGEFSKFLTSSFKERKIILEKFYNGIGLEQINLLINERLRNKKNEIENLDNQIIALNKSIEDIIIDDQDVEKLIHDHEQISSFTKRNTKYQTQVQDIVNSYETKTKNHKQLIIVEDSLKTITKTLNDLLATNNEFGQQKVEKSNLYLKRKPVLKKCIEQENSLKNFLESKKLLLEDINQATINSNNIEKNITSINEQLSDKNKGLNSFNDKGYEKFTEHDTEKNKIELLTLFQKHISLKENNKRLSSEIFKLNQSIADCKKNITHIKGRIEQINGKKPDLSINKLKLEAEDLKSLTQLITSFLTQEKKSLEKIEQKKVQLKDNEKKLDIKFTSLNKVESDIKINLNAQNYLNLNQAINKCVEESNKIDKCVVCNSPLESKLEMTKSDLQEDIKTNLEDLQSQKILISDEVNQLKATNISLSESITTEQKRLTDKKHEILSQWNNNSILPLSQNATNEQSLIVLSEKDKAYNKQISELEKLIIERNVKDSEEKSKTDNLQAFHLDLEQKNIQFTENNKSLNHTQEKYIKIAETLEPDLREMSSESHEKIVQKYDDLIFYQKLTVEVNHLSNTLSEKTTDFNQVKKHLKELNNRLSLLEDNINASNKFLSENLIKNKSADQELIEHEQGLEKLNQNIEEIEAKINSQKIIQAEHNSKKSNCEEQIKDCSLIIKRSSQGIKDSIDKDITSFSQIQRSETIFSLIKKLINIDISEINLEDLLKQTFIQFNTEKVFFENQHQELTEELTSKKALLKQKKKTQNDIEQINIKLKTLSLSLNELENLYSVIGKDEFRNYILSIIENTLIQQTNEELKKLCQGRYSLNQSNKKNRLITEFKIIDHYSDAMHRKVSTLSGGETFLVSLAMALALAELTRGQTQIDSLFIDEGFGTLDKETINEVFELLINIQHSGKQLGIISHVQELTTRIPVNISLVKDLNGSSKIEIIHN